MDVLNDHLNLTERAGDVTSSSAPLPLLPHHLQLSASVRDRITEFETTKSSSLVIDATADVGALGETTAVVTLTAISGTAPPAGRITSNTLQQIPVRNTVAAATTTTRGIPLLTFDNTVTCSDDYDMDDVIEIPLSATDEVIPYDPLTMRIRNEQKQMLKKHTQQKHLAYRNTSVSGRHDHITPPASPTRNKNKAAPTTVSKLPSGNSILSYDTHTKASNILSYESSVKPGHNLSFENTHSAQENPPVSSFSVSETVFVPNESVTWKSGIVKRQKQDFEELVKSIDSVKSATDVISSHSCSSSSSPPPIVSSSSLSVLNSETVDRAAAGNSQRTSLDTDPYLIVRSKSMKESSVNVREEDPFSNRVDRLFAKEEKKSQRLSCLLSSSSNKKDSPSRNNSWGSVDSAVVMCDRDRDIPSRQSSWGSCDTRVTSATCPSRNNSFGNFDMRKRLEEPISETQTGGSDKLTLVDSETNSDGVERQNTTTAFSYKDRNSLSRIGSFNGCGSQRLSDGLSTSFSSDQISSRSLSVSSSMLSKEDDIYLPPTLYRPKISTSDLKFDQNQTKNPDTNIYHNRISLTSRKVYLPPPFKSATSNIDSVNKFQRTDIYEQSTGATQSSAKVQKGAFRNHMDLSLHQVLPRDRSQSDVLSSVDILRNVGSNSNTLSTGEQQCSTVSSSVNRIMDSASTTGISDTLLDSKQFPFIIDSDSPDSCQTSPVDCTPLPGIVRQQRKRLESWMLDTETNKENKRQQDKRVSPISSMTTSAPCFSRSLSSCSMEFSAALNSKNSRITRSLSEKRSKFESKTYGGRVRKLTRDLEKNSVATEHRFTSSQRSIRIAMRQRSHSLERLSTSPNAPLSPTSPTSLASGSLLTTSQLMLDQLVTQAQDQAKHLEQEASDVSESSQESAEEVSVRSLVGIYEKPGNFKMLSNENRSTGFSTKSPPSKNRPRSDSVGEKLLPPVPKRKSSLDYTFKSPTRSVSQPPQRQMVSNIQELPNASANNSDLSYSSNSHHNPQVSNLPSSSDFTVPSFSSSRRYTQQMLQDTPVGFYDKDNSVSISSTFGRYSNKQKRNHSSSSIGNSSGSAAGGTSGSAGTILPKPPKNGYSRSFSFRTDESNKSDDKAVDSSAGASTTAATAAGVFNKGVTGSRSSPALSKNNILTNSSCSNNTNNSGGKSSRSHACSAELRQKKQQGKTHPLSRLPSRENSLH